MHLLGNRLRLRLALRILAVFGLMAVTMLVFRNLFPEGRPLPESGIPGPDGEVMQYDFATSLFDTDCKTTLFGTRAQVHSAYRELSEKLFRFHNCLNRFASESELSRFNAAPAGTPFPCSDELWMAFEAASKAYSDTHGAFDVTIAPLMDFWKEVAIHPECSPEEIASGLEAVQKNVGFALLEMDEANHTVTKSRKGLQADFGGLAKGLALDCARGILEKEGLEGFCLDFGGNIYQALPLQHPFHGKCAIADPRKAENTSELFTLEEVENKFISTSANTRRPISNDKNHPIGHILDTANGTPADVEYLSVTVVDDIGWRADALSTAIFAKGIPFARQLASEIPGLRIVFLTGEPAGKPIIIPGE